MHLHPLFVKVCRALRSCAPSDPVCCAGTLFCARSKLKFHQRPQQKKPLFHFVRRKAEGYRFYRSGSEHNAISALPAAFFIWL